MKAWSIPHIPHEDFVYAGDVQDIIASAGGVLNATVLESVMDLVNRKLARMRAKHAITLEHMRMASLKGQLIDNDGSVIYNWFTEFGVSQTTIDFAFSNAATDVLGLTRSLRRYMETNAYGETIGGIQVFTSPEWFDAFIAHATVKEAYKYYQQAVNPLTQDLRGGFTFGDVTFTEYNGSATQQNEDKTQTVRKFIPTNEAIAFPLGTQDTFVNYWAPPDFIDAVNVPSNTEVHVRTAVDPLYGRWVGLHTQSNPLPMCRRPALLVRLTKS
jgi:hypothetical protein